MAKKAYNTKPKKDARSVLISLDDDQMKNQLSPNRDTSQKVPQFVTLSAFDNTLPFKARPQDVVKLYFKASEKKNIYVNAICKGFQTESKKLKLRWECYKIEKSAPLFKLVSKEVAVDGKSPCIVVNVPESELGHKLEIRVKAYYEDDIELKNAVGNSITVQPIVIPKSISDEVSWLYLKDSNWHKVADDFFKSIKATVALSGYNNDDIKIFRYAKCKGKLILDTTHNLIAINGKVDIRFNRSEIASFVKAGDKVELICDVDGKKFSKELTIPQSDPVAPIKGSVSQPVMTGSYTVNDNNFKACKYTQIDVEYTKDKEGKEKQKVTVFKEGFQSTNTVNLIGGERKITVTLLEYTPTKCTLKENSHKKKKQVPFMLYGEEKSELPISMSGKIENIEVKYKYKVANIIKTICLPMSNIMQTSKLCTSNANCRHFNDVAFNIYPDIKWEAFVELSSSEPRLYSHTNMPAEYSIFKRHQKNALSAAKEDKDIGLSFSLMATYNDDVEIKLAAEIEKSVKTVFHVLKTIRDALDVLSFKKSVDDNKDKLKARNVLPKSSKLPVFIEISSPVLTIGGGWQYDLNSANQLIRKGEIAIAASPLIEAKGGIDLIACSTFIPVVGQIIKGILKLNDFAEWATKYLSKDKTKYEGLIWFNIYLKGSLSIAGTFDFSKEAKTVDISSPVNIVFVVELGLSAEVKVETVTISGNTTYTVRAGASGEASTGLTFKPSMGYSTEDGMYLGFEVRFDGIILKVSGEAKFEENRDGRETFSIGAEISKEPLPPLIAPCSIWQGKVYPFRETKK